jgi:PAS domain S-box-containing protein
MRLRKTGIDFIGYVPWGAHIGQIYSSKDDFFDVTVPYIKEGLLNNELCVWIYSQNTNHDEIKQKIKRQLVNVDEFISRGQLIIIPYTKLYIKDNSFNEIRTNEQWTKLIERAINCGFNGLRGVGDTAWLEKSYFKRFCDYEENINKFMQELPFIVMCLYDAAKINLFEAAEIIKNHSYVIIRDNNELRVLKNIELLIKSKQLEQSKENYERLIRLLPDAVFIHDKQKILYCNESAANIVGEKCPNNLYGKLILEFIEDKNKNNYEEFIDIVLDGKSSFNFLQSKIVDVNGQCKDVEVVATRYVYGNFHAVLAVIRDVSPFKRIVELERDIERSNELLNKTREYDRIKTEFFANLSHELRTPLNVILSALQLVDTSGNSTNQDNYVKKYYKMMKQNCYRLLRLINNLIDITKIDSDFFQLQLQNCNIVEIVENVTLSIAGYIESKGIELQFDTNTEEKIISCDPDQIERIIFNLLSNAIKFTPPGGNIYVNVIDSKDSVIISVKDNGIGIPRDKQEIIFGRFQQVDRLTTRQYEGSGIGLSLVKSLVEKHNGKISVTSEIGKGSEFIIEIPNRVLPGQVYGLDAETNLRGHNYAERANIELADIYI